MDIKADKLILEDSLWYLKSLLLETCPFPHLGLDNLPKSGLLYKLPNYCHRKCRIPKCKTMEAPTEIDKELEHDICLNGFSVYRLSFSDIPGLIIILCGLIDKAHNMKCSRDRKKANKANRIETELVTKWAKTTATVQQMFSEAIAETNRKALSLVHDVKSAAAAVNSNLEKYIRNEFGKNLTPENLEKMLSKDLLTVYKATQCLLCLLYTSPSPRD